MRTFRLEIVTPEGKKFEGEAERLIINTTEGQIGILGGHADYFATLDIGLAKILSNGNEIIAACSGGMLSVSKGKVSVAAVTFEFSDEIDTERAEKARERADKTISESRDRTRIAAARIKRARALNRLKAAKK